MGLHKKEQRTMNQFHRVIFKVDITQIEGEGEFPCPKCGVIISPDDKTETVYKIVDIKVKNQNLEEIAIQCNKCGSKIHLVGLYMLFPTS
jgi:predicted RNA-binding Zn-ribbon protein involved in translation (DUF1610 family)